MNEQLIALHPVLPSAAGIVRIKDGNALFSAKGISNADAYILTKNNKIYSAKMKPSANGWYCEIKIPNESIDSIAIMKDNEIILVGSPSKDRINIDHIHNHLKTHNKSSSIADISKSNMHHDEIASINKARQNKTVFAPIETPAPSNTQKQAPLKETEPNPTYSKPAPVIPAPKPAIPKTSQAVNPPERIEPKSEKPKHEYDITKPMPIAENPNKQPKISEQQSTPPIEIKRQLEELELLYEEYYDNNTIDIDHVDPLADKPIKVDIYNVKPVIKKENKAQQNQCCLPNNSKGQLYCNAFPKAFPNVNWCLYSLPAGSQYLYTKNAKCEYIAFPGTTSSKPPAGLPLNAKYAISRGGMSYWIFRLNS